MAGAPRGLGAFVSARGSAELQAALEALPGAPAPVPTAGGGGGGGGGGGEAGCLVVGPRGSGKTTALFHCAHATASAGGSALLLTARAGLEARPPLLPEGAAPGDAAWERVQLRYLEEPGELERFAATVHLLPGSPPDVLLVDDVDARLDTFGVVGGGRRKQAAEMALVRRMAYLHEACRALSARLPGERTCRLVVSATGGAGENLLQELYIYKRWTPLVVRLQAAAEAAGSFELSVLPTELTRGHSICAARVRYSLALGSHLVVEQVWAEGSLPTAGA